MKVISLFEMVLCSNRICDVVYESLDYNHQMKGWEFCRLSPVYGENKGFIRGLMKVEEWVYEAI